MKQYGDRTVVFLYHLANIEISSKGAMNTTAKVI